MAAENLGPLDWRIPIVTTDGRPTAEFQRRWATQVDNNSEIGDPGDPTAIAKDTAVIGVADTFMRSDSAPAIQKATDSQFGLVQVDGTTITETGGVISAAAGGSAAWTTIASGSTGTVANIDFTNLGGYSDFLFLCRSVTASVSNVRTIHASVDNGATFFSTSGNYVQLNTNGTETATTALGFHTTASTAARSTSVLISGNIAGNPRWALSPGAAYVMFVASNSVINALRFSNNLSGNLTGGTYVLYGR
jgi:hypothetical protein